MPIRFHSRFPSGFALLDLLTQRDGDFEPRGFQRVVAGFGLNVGPGHGQRYVRAKSRCAVPLVFHDDDRNRDGDEVSQLFKRLLQ